MFNNQLVSTLNAFEFKVYNYVIKNHQTVIYMTVRELAEACDVSTATILRFCKKMNCSGYAEFKAYLKMNAEKRGEISLPHGANEFLSFFKSINNDEFDALIASAAEQIAGAERVIFVGAGSSGTLGRYGARFFSNIGKFSNHIDDPYYPVNTDMYKQAVAIVLSVSGETTEIYYHPGAGDLYHRIHRSPVGKQDKCRGVTGCVFYVTSNKAGILLYRDKDECFPYHRFITFELFRY